MTTLLQVSINYSAINAFSNVRSNKQRWGSRLFLPINLSSVFRAKIGSLHKRRFKLGVSRERWSLGLSRAEDRIFVKDEGKRRKRVVSVKFNQGFGSNGGGGGGDNGSTARIVGNLALVIGLTYLSITGQLGWVLDAIVSVWLLVVILPILGLGAFLWWAGRDIVQGSQCPNCGNEFQIFRSAINDDLQLCPFCSQPFSVVDDKFVRDPGKFSNQSTTFGQEFDNFSPRSNKEKDFSTSIVDIEAEVRDVE